MKWPRLSFRFSSFLSHKRLAVTVISVYNAAFASCWSEVVSADGVEDIDNSGKDLFERC